MWIYVLWEMEVACYASVATLFLSGVLRSFLDTGDFSISIYRVDAYGTGVNTVKLLF